MPEIAWPRTSEVYRIPDNRPVIMFARWENADGSVEEFWPLHPQNEDIKAGKIERLRAYLQRNIDAA